VVVAALPLGAATLDTAKFAQISGVRMDGGAKVNIVECQTLAAKVINVAVLAKLGLKGAKNDIIQSDTERQLEHIRNVACPRNQTSHQ
jgi:hypothetical protein